VKLIKKQYCYSVANTTTTVSPR